GVLDPTGGTAIIQGHDIRVQPLLSRAHMGIVPEEANVYVDLSVWQNLMLMAELHGVPRGQRVEEGGRLLEAMGLADRKKQKARVLSKGLRQRLMLCSALVTGPEILFLDEPTSGLDVQSAQLIRRIVRERNRDGLTVFLTTHNMDEAEEMCGRVAIINKGRIAAVDTPDGLREAIRAGQYTEVSFESGDPEAGDLEGIPAVRKVAAESGSFRLFTETPGRVAVETVRLADTRGWRISHLCTRKPSLEDVFLHLTAEEPQAAGGRPATGGRPSGGGRQEVSP
ncbi:MAG: ATP-binding cassette domain-containing protein, partial [Spirochaetota bacterium]